MTATLVVRLSKKELAQLDAEARKRSLSRSAYVRKQLRLNGKTAAGARTTLRRFKGVGRPKRLSEFQAKSVVEEHSENEVRASDRNRTNANAEKRPLKTGGANWAEHFEWLKKNGRKVDWKLAEELRNQERNRWPI